MAELPDLDIGAAMKDAGMPQPGGAPPEASPAEAAGAAAPAPASMPTPDEIDQILSGMDSEAMVAPPSEEPSSPNFDAMLEKLRPQQDDEEKSLLTNRVQQLEKQLSDVMGRFEQQKFLSETARVRGGIDHAVKKAVSDVSVGHVKLDKAAADFIEGTLVYRLAQQQQKNPTAPVDTDAIQRFATKAAQALSRWAKEHSRKTETETRKASVGTAARPKAQDFELKTDADFDKYVAAFIGKGG